MLEVEWVSPHTLYQMNGQVFWSLVSWVFKSKPNSYRPILPAFICVFLWLKQMPKVQYRSNCKPSTFAYPPPLEVPKEKEKEKVCIVNFYLVKSWPETLVDDFGAHWAHNVVSNFMVCFVLLFLCQVSTAVLSITAKAKKKEKEKKEKEEEKMEVVCMPISRALFTPLSRKKPSVCSSMHLKAFLFYQPLLKTLSVVTIFCWTKKFHWSNHNELHVLSIFMVIESWPKWETEGFC